MASPNLRLENAPQALLHQFATASDLTGKEGFAVAVVSATGTVDLAGDGAEVIGCVWQVESTSSAIVQLAAIPMWVEAGAALNESVKLASDSAGRYVAATTGEEVVALSLMASKASGDSILVLPYAAQPVLVAASAYTQTYSTGNKTVANPTAAAVTDSGTGTDGGAIAAGVGKQQICLQIDLAAITGNGDVVTTFTPGYKFKLLAFDFIVNSPATTADKLTTLNLEIGTTNVTGGEIALTSANCTPLGAEVAGAAITANNTGSASDTISLEASATTTFAEGSGSLVITIQNMDTADAFAALAAEVAALIADDLDNRQSITSIIDDLQAHGLVG